MEKFQVNKPALPLKLDLQFFAENTAVNHVEQAQTLWHDAKAIMDEYEGKSMPKDKETQLDKLFDDIEMHQKKAEQVERGKKAKQFFDEPQRKVPYTSKTDQNGVQAEEHKSIFRKYYKEGKSGFEPTEKKILSSLNDPDGGVLAPEEFRTELIEKRRDLVFMRQIGRVLTTGSASVGFPVFDYDADVEWTAESAAIADSDPQHPFGKQTFTPHKLARILRIPNELLEDSVINIESLMTSYFAERFGEIEENAFINGDGINKPLGLLEAGLPTNQATDTGGTFSADDLFDQVYSVRAVYRAGASFLMPRNAVRRVRKFKDNDGQYLWQPAIQAGQPSTLLGYPLFESEFFPDNVAAGSENDPLLAFGDFSWYWIVDRVGMSVQRLVERYAEFDQTGLKMRLRTDGAPVKADPFSILVRGS